MDLRIKYNRESLVCALNLSKNCVLSQERRRIFYFRYSYKNSEHENLWSRNLVVYASIPPTSLTRRTNYNITCHKLPTSSFREKACDWWILLGVTKLKMTGRRMMVVMLLRTANEEWKPRKKAQNTLLD